MERISGVLARRRPAGVLAAALTLSIAALIGTMLPAVSTASDVSHGPQSSPMLTLGSGYGQPKGSDDVRALQRRLRHVGFAPGRSMVSSAPSPRERFDVSRLVRDWRQTARSAR